MPATPSVPSLSSLLLATDLGNTDLKAALFELQTGQVIWAERFTHKSLAQEETCFHALQEALKANVASRTLTGWVSCSVVKRLNSSLEAAVQPLLNEKSLVLPITADLCSAYVAVSNYPTLGLDRWVNLCAARLLQPSQTVVVVDLGTATTFSVLSGEGVFLGGSILPGLSAYSQLVTQHAEALKELILQPLEAQNAVVLGHTSEEALFSGLRYGYRGSILETLSAIQDALIEQGEVLEQVVFTGGQSETCLSFMPKLTSYSFTHHKHWTLKGLLAIYNAFVLNAEKPLS